MHVVHCDLGLDHLGTCGFRFVGEGGPEPRVQRWDQTWATQMRAPHNMNEHLAYGTKRMLHKAFGGRRTKGLRVHGRPSVTTRNPLRTIDVARPIRCRIGSSPITASVHASGWILSPSRPKRACGCSLPALPLPQHPPALASRRFQGFGQRFEEPPTRPRLGAEPCQMVRVGLAIHHLKLPLHKLLHKGRERRL